MNKPNGTALRWLLGPLLMVVAIGLWLVPMLIAVRTGNTPDLVNYRNEVLWGQTIQRYSSFEGHQHHLGYYFFQAIPTLWMPVSLLLPWFIPAWFRRLKRRDARYLFLLGWVVLVVLFFTFSSGKRGVYILPATPALALACAPLVAARIDKLPGVRRISFGVLFFLTLVFLLLGAVWNSNMAMEWTSQISQHGIEPAGFLFSLGVIGLLWAVFCRPQRGLLALAGFLASLWILYGWWGYPILDPARSSSLLMQAVNQSVPADIDLAIVGWKEQMILHAKRPITHWGYLGDRQRNPATEAKVRSMASWLQDGKKRRAALMPRSWLEPCFQAGDHVSFGKWHGFQWVLVDATDTTGNCDEDVEHHDAIFRTMPVHAQQIRPGDFP